MWHTVFHQEQKFQEVYENDTIENDDLLSGPLRGAVIMTILFLFFPVLLASLALSRSGCVVVWTALVIL